MWACQWCTEDIHDHTESAPVQVHNCMGARVRVCVQTCMYVFGALWCTCSSVHGACRPVGPSPCASLHMGSGLRSAMVLARGSCGSVCMSHVYTMPVLWVCTAVTSVQCTGVMGVTCSSVCACTGRMHLHAGVHICTGVGASTSGCVHMRIHGHKRVCIRMHVCVFVRWVPGSASESQPWVSVARALQLWSHHSLSHGPGVQQSLSAWWSRTSVSETGGACGSSHVAWACGCTSK